MLLLSFVSSFRFLLFLFQFRQHISQFLQDLKSTKEELWSTPKPQEGAQCSSARFGEGRLGLRADYVTAACTGKQGHVCRARNNS